jgi:iron(III) transport system permease protein
MGLDIVLGLTIAYLVVRTRLPGRRLLDATAMMPLAVPGLVMAFGYVAMSNEIRAWLGDATPTWLQVTGETPNPIVFLVIAYAIRRLPYVVRSAAAGLEQTPIELEEAAAVFGASKMTTIRRIVMPLILANLIAGGLLAFSFAMLEVSDSLILAQTQDDYPITKAIYVLFERLGDGPYVASAMGVWGMLLLALTLVGASLMLGKKLGAIFRI